MYYFTDGKGAESRPEHCLGAIEEAAKEYLDFWHKMGVDVSEGVAIIKISTGEVVETIAGPGGPAAALMDRGFKG